MNMPTALSLFIIIVTGLVGCTSSGARVGPAPLEAVETLDHDRYLGRWFEIARYPNSFQRGLVGVTAEYSARSDGAIQVVNRGHVGTLDGREKSARAKAWIPDPSAPGKLKVRFFWPFTGAYWVIDLADDYAWAVVGEPSRRYLWILSRTPELDEETLAMIEARITRHGYDVERLQRTRQR